MLYKKTHYIPTLTHSHVMHDCRYLFGRVCCDALDRVAHYLMPLDVIDVCEAKQRETSLWLKLHRLFISIGYGNQTLTIAITCKHTHSHTHVDIHTTMGIKNMDNCTYVHNRLLFLFLFPSSFLIYQQINQCFHTRCSLSYSGQPIPNLGEGGGWGEGKEEPVKRSPSGIHVC